VIVQLGAITSQCESCEEREVLGHRYPWTGCIVRVHETLEQVDGTVLRRSPIGRIDERWLQLPAWILIGPDLAFAALLAVSWTHDLSGAVIAQALEWGWGQGRSSSMRAAGHRLTSFSRVSASQACGSTPLRWRSQGAKRCRPSWRRRRRGQQRERS